MKAGLARLRRLRASEQVMVAALVPAALAVRAGVRAVSLPRLVAACDAVARSPLGRLAPARAPERVFDMVDLAARATRTDGLCLTRALLFATVVAARGRACRLVIASRVDGEGSARRLRAHAWVEEGPVRYDDPAEDGAFQPLTHFDLGAPARG